MTPSLFLCPEAAADTVRLKDGSELKGLIVEQHEDRLIMNTEQGEQPVMRDKIDGIEFDDPAQTFLQIGEEHEAAESWGEALAYYEKALQLEPEFEDARRAVVRVRNRFWSKSADGPNEEIERMQSRYELRGEVKPRKGPEASAKDAALALEDGLGITLEQSGDWAVVSAVAPQKDAALAGLRKGDRLVSVDGRSLRYLNADVVRRKLLEPPRSIFTLEYERDCALYKTGFERNVSEFGLKAALEYRGTVITAVDPGSEAARAGLKENDLLVTVNGVSMRYLPLKRLLSVLLEGPAESSTLAVRRAVTMTRKG